MHALGDDLKQRRQTARVGALGVGEGNGRWLQALGRWAIACARGAVAAGAVLGVERSALGQVGLEHRCHREGVELGQLCGGAVGQGGHGIGGGLVLNGCTQLVDAPGQFGAAWALGQFQNLALRRGREVQHFGVFARIGDAAILHGTAVVHGHVFQQLPQLACFGWGRCCGLCPGMPSQPARQHGPYPPKFAMHKRRGFK